MAKFSKKLQKLVKKNLENSISVGFSESRCEEFLETFKTIFVVNRYAVPPKHRSIIHISDVDFLSNVYNIDVIFIEQMFEPSDLVFLHSLLRRLNPVVLLNQQFGNDNQYIDGLRKLRYEHVDFFEEYQVWKIIRR